MAAKIHLERMMHRSSIAVAGESAASYALIKLIPSGLGQVSKPMGLNLALVIDVSGSMYDEDTAGVSRLDRVKKAAAAAIQKLKPEDTMCIVAFAYNASMLLPPTQISEREKIEKIINTIDQYDVEPNGTAMNDGMKLALDEVAVGPRRGSDAGSVERIDPALEEDLHSSIDPGPSETPFEKRVHRECGDVTFIEHERVA